MTNRELAAALRLCGSVRTCDECLKCPFFEGCDPDVCIPKMTSACADALANSESHVMALQQEIEKLRGQLEVERRPQWVSVTERLPKAREDVLVRAYWHEAWQTMVGWHEPQRGIFAVYTPQAGVRTDLTVTHWMPLPEFREVDE